MGEKEKNFEPKTLSNQVLEAKAFNFHSCMILWVVGLQ